MDTPCSESHQDQHFIKDGAWDSIWVAEELLEELACLVVGIHIDSIAKNLTAQRATP